VVNNISLNRKSGAGHHVHKVTEKIQEPLIKNNVSSIAKSYRSLRKKYNLSGHTVKKKVLIDSGVKYKGKKGPKK
jgi:hypothetical protein